MRGKMGTSGGKAPLPQHRVGATTLTYASLFTEASPAHRNPQAVGRPEAIKHEVEKRDEGRGSILTVSVCVCEKVCESELMCVAVNVCVRGAFWLCLRSFFVSDVSVWCV